MAQGKAAGRIFRIDREKDSKTGAETFIRVCFTLDGGAFAKTDLCPTFRNFSRWEKLLFVGNVLGGLDMKNDKTVDADSHPFFIRFQPEPPHRNAPDQRPLL